MCFFGIQNEDLPCHVAVSHHEGSNGFGSQPTHRLKAMPSIRSPEPISRGDYGNDWVEKTAGLINNVGQTLVMRVGQIPLKRCGLDSTNRQNQVMNVSEG